MHIEVVTPHAIVMLADKANNNKKIHFR